MSSEKKRYLLRPADLAWYMAVSAFCMSWPTSSPSSGNTLMPTLVVAYTSWPSMRKGCLKRSTSLWATTSASSA